jgi:phospholipase D1/2
LIHPMLEPDEVRTKPCRGPGLRTTMESRILLPGRNVWRIEQAARAAVLVDGAAFFGAVRRAFLNAQRSIFVVGWDIDSRTRLVGDDNDASDGYSPVLVEFLAELVATRPDLHVYLLLWDYSLVYAMERELFPRLSLQWRTPDRVTLCMDDAVPFGSSQHQKLIVVDDALAFSGGLDLTLRRWDTCEHKADNPDRVDASGRCYSPFHDVQMMVDGRAAEALAVLARRRWCRAYGTEPALEPRGDPWPQTVPPHFADVEVGIARTQPAFEQQAHVREVEALFLDSIDCATRSIYIENQFVTSLTIAERLARRLDECPQLEIVVVSPRVYDSWVVSQTFGQERAHALRTLTPFRDRVRVMYPAVEENGKSVGTMVHSKVMVVDDRLLRVGSANLNNRSMAVDTECDLVIEARTDAERAAIANIRNLLLGDHCGVGADAVAAMLVRRGSLVAAVDRLSSNGHRLRPIDDPDPHDSELAEALTGILDPAKPLSLGGVWQRVGDRLSAKIVAGIAVAGVIVLLTLLWHLLPPEIASRDRVQALLSSASESAFAPLLVMATYVVAGVVAFPVLVLIVATAAIFGPWFGFVYAVLGVIASALFTYLIGRWLGRDLLHRALGARCERVRKEMDKRGVLAVAAIRLVPVAPFTVVNLMAGACSIALIDYVAGTLIGMLPGLIVISALGHQVAAMLTTLSVRDAAVLALLVLAWLTLVLGAQALVGRWKRQAS